MLNRETCLTHEEISTLLVDAGVKPTAQRIAICRHVLGEADHPTAEDIKRWADRNFPKMSLATVYNSLRVLTEAGVLKELRLPHSESLHYEANIGEHVHFLDLETGELIDLPPETVRMTDVLGPDYQVRGMDVLIRGHRRGRPPSDE